jgi:hypothetical protein
MNPKNLLVAIGFGVALIGSSDGQNLVMNGGFESPGVAEFRFMSDGATNVITGWTVIDDGIGERPYYQAIGRQPMSVYSGRYGVVLNQGSGISTRFPAVSGTTYELSFWFRPSTAYSVNIMPDPVQVRIAGFETTFAPDEAWTNAIFRFTPTASDPVATLEIFNPSPVGDYRIYYIDAVSITAEAAPPPPLAIELSTGVVRLSWPLSASAWVLEESGGLDAADGWLRVSPPYESDEDNWFFSLPATAGSRFFRLVRP